MTKNEKRLAAKAAKAAAEAEAARRRQRRQLVTIIVAVIVVAALVVIGVLVFGGKKHDSAAKATPSVSASASPEAFASLPPGADPALGTKPTVKPDTTTPTKLDVTTLIQGTGAAVKSGQNLTVNYVGVSDKDGSEFDSSWKNSQAFTFVVGQGNVIPGWDQGLVGVKVGSRVQLDIPSNLAYGDNPTNGAPAGALRFVVDVLAAQ
ncbi:FKBP-type peptidyl-prolyl cis-trans isomerase [Rugosimonospora acidiphila]